MSRIIKIFLLFINKFTLRTLNSVLVKAITAYDIGDNFEELPISQAVKIRKALAIELLHYFILT